MFLFLRLEFKEMKYTRITFDQKLSFTGFFSCIERKNVIHSQMRCLDSAIYFSKELRCSYLVLLFAGRNREKIPSLRCGGTEAENKKKITQMHLQKYVQPQLSG